MIFLGRAVKARQIKKVVESSKTKRAHIIHITHRDEVETPITDWMKEAYELQTLCLGVAAKEEDETRKRRE